MKRNLIEKYTENLYNKKGKKKSSFCPKKKVFFSFNADDLQKKSKRNLVFFFLPCFNFFLKLQW